VFALVLLALGVLLSVLTVGGKTPVAEASNANTALILASSVSGGVDSPEANEAEANGFTVTLASDAQWAAMTAADFAQYQLVVVGDPTCGNLRPVVSQNAQALADAVMAEAGGNTKVGNRILIGTDPVFHYGQGGNKMVAAGIDFTSAVPGATSLYLDFTCSDPDYDGNGKRDGLDKLLPLLSIDPGADTAWSENAGPPCGGDVSLISNADQFSSLSSADIRNWSCSVHESFPTFPADWTALAIATDTPSHPTCGNDVDTGDARCGEAYVLISGSGITAEAPDLSVTPLTATNPTGTNHTVTATVTNPDDTPRSGVTVSFIVTGANAGASGACDPAGCVTGADGKVKFTYTGVNEGDDTINVSMTIDGTTQTATAAKTWVAPGGVEGPPGDASCSDAADNDGDGKVDQADPDCQGPEGPPGSASCSDGIDNDGDGKVDAADTGCQTISGAPKCFGQPATITGNGNVVGTKGDDVIYTGNGADTVDGRGGNDRICTHGGSDYVRGGTGNDRISAGGGADDAGGQAGNDRVQGVSGNDKVQGSLGDDVVRGGAGNDRLNGGPGADRLFGEADNDVLAGGSDAPDRCDGGGGTDHTTPGGGGCETIANIP
jgi:Ca2+-binding RTX toxin-like protein